ncbi:glycosyltransferase family A protein [Nocardioides guangzhouensis]|uniref:glycosyltransferase family A protein n=1 Tax=Nocardioides guangzhouensis TaxID=2497878 RepID=UPI00143852F1|nr:glycosyltransferase family A protein [Nocardioides guangzhouensis]
MTTSLSAFVSDVPASARRPARRRRDRAAARLRRTARTLLPRTPEPSPDWARPPRRLPARVDVLAAVAVGPRLAAGLALELPTSALAPDAWPAPGTVDLVLVEVRDGAIPVPRAPLPPGGTAPLVLWATSGGPSDDVADLVRSATAVLVADPAALAAWRTVAPSAGLLAPGASTRRPPGTGPREGVALVVDGPVPPALAGTVSTVVAAALRSVRDRLLVHRTDPGAPLPRVLSAAATATTPEDVVPGLAAAAVVVDGVRTHPDDTWTVLESAAVQTAVVTPAGWPLPEGVTPATGGDAAALRAAVVARLEQPELRDREARRLHRALVHRHGLDRRVAELLGGAGIPTPPRSRAVSAVVPTRRAHEIDNVLANVGRQSHRDTELVLVLHGLDVDHADLRARARDAGVPGLVLVEAAPTLTLGACMNLGVDAAGGDLVAKMDDDNHYGTHYLTDLVASVDTSGAGIVGKAAHYVWLRANDAVVLRYADAEHSYQRRVQGGSMLFDGEVVRRLRFSDIPRAVDSDILDRAIAQGVKIWSADRFNYVSVRGDDRTAHTWQVADDQFLTATGRLAFFGDPRTHVEV